MKTVHLSHLFFIKYVVAFACFSFVEAGSKKWEKLEHTIRMVRDLMVGVGHHNKEQRHGLTLVSGGFPRTGTKTIETALTHLGHKIYDVRAMLQHDHFSEWTSATKEWKEENNLQSIQKMVEKIELLGYTATLDAPMNLLAPAFIRVRPDAKVLWNYRAKGMEDWYRSFGFINWWLEGFLFARPWKWIFPNVNEKNQPLFMILLPWLEPPDRSSAGYFERPLPWFERQKGNVSFLDDKEVKQNWMETYQSWPKQLKDALSEAKGEDAIDTQYLEYTVQEGWEPLLGFLSDDADDRQKAMESLSSKGFPHVNDRSTMILIRQIMDFIGMIFPLFVLFVAYVLYLLIRGFVGLFRNAIGLVTHKHEMVPKAEKVD
mmetsp:Transcript_10198/g.22078  ORF Transcript_10198/g.22078 Transcript_10198/m.22078 type:complete len:373 (+) Transcript_10198:166-1284(+)